MFSDRFPLPPRNSGWDSEATDEKDEQGNRDPQWHDRCFWRRTVRLRFDKDDSKTIEKEEALNHWKQGFGKISAMEFFNTVDYNNDGQI